MPQSELTALGWTPFFSAQITAEESSRLTPARVVAVHKYAFTLAADPNHSFAGVASGKILHPAEYAPDLPVVGDWVLVSPPSGGTSVIARRLERRTALARRRPLDRNSFKTSSQPQVLAANLDTVFIVMSLNQDLNVPRLERALTLVWNSGATPVVLLSKSDLSPDPEAQALSLGAAAAGAEVRLLSSLTGRGVDEIRAGFKPGMTGCLIGSSGAGKTTLINALCGSGLKTLAVRADDDRGRHATTARSLFFLPQGGMLIDTPGVRELGLLDDFDLSGSFADLGGLAAGCRFTDCTHRTEPGCAVLAALESGALPRERYESYLKLCRELEHEAGKHTLGKRLEAKRKEKQLGKLIKDYNRHRP